MATTTRWSLPYPALDGTDPADVPFWMNALAVALDGVAMDDQGTLAHRPVSTALSPGKKGRYYMVVGDSTSANNGILWRDNGTGWDQVGTTTLIDTKANRPAATAVPVGMRFFATDQVAEWLSDGTTWHRLGDQVGDIIWTAEASARTGYILLHGQAWPATTGIYADLHDLWGGSTLPDAQGRDFIALGTHADVDTLLDNDGVPLGNRTPKHNSTVVETAHTHRILESGGGGSHATIQNGAGASTSYTDVNDESKHYVEASTTGITVGPGGTRPIDMAAYIALQPQAKL